MANVIGAVYPFAPFDQPVPLPTSDPDEGSLVCLQVAADWMPYILGACQALFADSTWDSSDPSALDTNRVRVNKLINILSAYDACPMPIQFRPWVAHGGTDWQYSEDAGTTWLDGPECAVSFELSTLADSFSPSGYKVTVNQGQSYEPWPQINGTVNDVVRTDPGSSAINDVAPASGVVPLNLQSLLARTLIMQSTRMALQIAKVIGADTAGADEAVVQLEKAASDVADVLVTVIV